MPDRDFDKDWKGGENMSDFKSGFNWQDRTIKSLVPDGTRERAIHIRLSEIHQVKMRDFELSYELQMERSNLIEEAYQICRNRYECFVKGGGR